jgi:hypothetical protein
VVNYSAYLDRDRDELPLDFPSDNSLVCSDILDALAQFSSFPVRFISMIFISWFCELTSQPGWERVRKGMRPPYPNRRDATGGIALPSQRVDFARAVPALRLAF